MLLFVAKPFFLSAILESKESFAVSGFFSTCAIASFSTQGFGSKMKLAGMGFP